jgi:hypothetical protein
MDGGAQADLAARVAQIEAGMADLMAWRVEIAALRAEVGALKAVVAEDRQRTARLEQLVRAADYALLERLLDVIGPGRSFTVESLIDAAAAAKEDGSSALASAISGVAGRGDGQRVKLGLWLGRLCEEPIGGIGARKLGRVGNATVYQLERR